MTNDKPIYKDRRDLPYSKETGDYPTECGACGHIDDIRCFDCLGADEDCLFCNNCGVELRPEPSSYVPPLKFRKRRKA